MLERVKRFVWFCGFAGKSVFGMLFEMYTMYRVESMRERLIPSAAVTTAADDGEDAENTNRKRRQEYPGAYA